MAHGADKISDLIAEIWDRSHHIFKKVAGSQKILRWLIYTDELVIVEEEAFNTSETPYPAVWASAVFDPNENIHWNEGVWA